MYQYNLGIKFKEIVNKYPDNIALKFPITDTVINYSELDKRSNQFARFLLNNGIEKRDVVCIAGDKIDATFFCMLACLKIGAIYSIFDPDSPIERLKKIINTCQPKAIFAGEKLKEQIENTSSIEKIKIVKNEGKTLIQEITKLNDRNLIETREVTGADPAYIMFTSGSTGFPKGAVMTHSNVSNFIEWNIETFGFIHNDVLTNVNPLYFDNSVFDFYSALFSGACLIPFSKEAVTNPKLLLELIDNLKCTSWFSVPSLLIFLQTLRALKKDNMRYIKRFIFGGEGYPKAKLKALYDLYAHRSIFFNVYGPTECTCMCSAYIINSEDFMDLHGFPPLGRIAENFSCLILDEAGKEVLNNEVGELCLVGPNVGKGYYNDPERTEISFMQNPNNDHFAEKIYKTGDLVRYNPDDGKIYIIGRKDFQVKHMGYRIELEEIETALSQLSHISQAAVIHGNKRGLSHLIGIVSTQNEIAENLIRNDLKDIIPDYMIPTTFHFVSELPKNPSGKIDRKRLAEIYLK